MMKTIAFFLLVVCIESCSRIEDPIDRINNKLKIDNKGALQKNIPAAYNDSNAYWDFVKRETIRVGLPSIENGSASIEIRVWEDFEWGRMVFVIRCKDSTWTAEDYIYRAFSNGGVDIDSIAVDTVRLIKPKVGWNKFMNKLIDKGVLDLKDKSNIPRYPIISEFWYIAVEIAAKNYYRYYSLPNARELTSKVKDDKAMLEILDLIYNEFPELMSAISRHSKTGINK